MIDVDIERTWLNSMMASSQTWMDASERLNGMNNR